MFKFYGIETSKASVVRPREVERKIQFFGASDSAGFCIDGTEDMGPAEWGPVLWKYENCDMGAPA
jgi:hypothetical protein